MTAGLDTRAVELYAPMGEVLPFRRRGGDGAVEGDSDASRSLSGPAVVDGFASSRAQFESLVRFLDGTDAAGLDHAGLEERLDRDGREPGDLLVISADGKGIVMRPDALRPKAAAARGRPGPKHPKTRLASAENSNYKRMAEIGAVYDATPGQPLVGSDGPPSRPRCSKDAPAKSPASSAAKRPMLASIQSTARSPKKPPPI